MNKRLQLRGIKLTVWRKGFKLHLLICAQWCLDSQLDEEMNYIHTFVLYIYVFSLVNIGIS